MSKPDPTAAQRAQRRREREKLGIRVISLEITADQIAALEAENLIEAEDFIDEGKRTRAHIALGISWLLDALCINAVDIDYDRLVEHIPPEEKLSAAG